MAKLITGNKYLSLFLNFLKGEIPSIIQIFSIPTLFGILISKNFLTTILISVLVIFLVSIYLIEKMSRYLHSQINDDHSFLNRYKLDFSKLIKKWVIYTKITAAVSGFAAGFIVGITN